MFLHTGVEVVPPPPLQPITLHGFSICVAADLPARASVQNIMQFNGFYGCTFCEQPGKTVATRQDGHGHVHIFPYIQQNPKGPRRTHQSCLQHDQEATAQHPVSLNC